MHCCLFRAYYLPHFTGESNAYRISALHSTATWKQIPMVITPDDVARWGFIWQSQPRRKRNNPCPERYQCPPLGCKVALDDFGTGLSSFSYLKTFAAADYLKIDGGFVRDMLQDPMDAAIVQAINNIGHVAGMKTIAEFVENKDIQNRLTEMGVDYAQGYGIHKPEAIDPKRGS